ncbi:brachyurin-like [Schistocerca piceifrons]|uniref:brachyurin-like n=1 Tax=Schistocerca piceifrons TaxID=274613 RepID=UPI001F5F9888|nr:brachyurin-like [Schistocerca piceifrons]
MWEVRLGLTSLSIIEPSCVTIVTRSATVQSEYNPNNLCNDIAVVFLGTNVPINNYIGLVNLPSRSQASNSFEGQTATVSGWGLNTDNGVIPDTLQYTTLNVMSNTQCSQYFGGPILDFTLCGVGSSGQSTCNGDSGGALVVGSQGSYTQIGIVSWGSGKGCASGDPAGFTRVTYFLDWISNKSLLYDIKDKTHMGISTVDGNKLQCHLAGKLDPYVSVNGESDMVTAHNVHYVKNVATNLLSVGEIVKKGNTVTFDMQGARVISESGEVIATANIRAL